MLNTQCEKVENCCLFRSFVPPKIRGSQPISRPIGGGLEMRAAPFGKGRFNCKCVGVGVIARSAWGSL